MVQKLSLLCFLACSFFVSTAQPLPFFADAVVWFSADSVKPLPDNKVAEWKNNVAPETLVQSNSRYYPLLVSDAINSKPAVSFNGAANQYLNGGNIAKFGSEGQSIFVLTKLNSNANNRTLLAKSANGTTQFKQNKYAIRCSGTNKLYFEYTDNGSFISKASDALTDYAVVSTAVDLKQGTMAFFANSKQVDRINLRQNHEFKSSFDFLVGAYNNASGTTPQADTYFNGLIAEIIIYKRALSQLERQEVENYLRKKYLPGTERLPISLGEDIFQAYSLAPLELNIPDKDYFTSIEWSTGESTPTIIAEKSGIYTVEVTDDWGWKYFDTIRFAKPEITPLRDTTICLGESITWHCGIEDSNDGYSYRWSTGATTASIEISASGTYWVEVEDSFGNIARSAEATVTVDNFAEEISLGNDSELCIGNILEIVSGNTDNIEQYKWSTGETTASIEVSTAGKYWVEAINANGCVANATLNITLKEDAIAPTVDFSIENACENQETILRSKAIAPEGSAIVQGIWTVGNQQFGGNVYRADFPIGEQVIQFQAITDKGCSAQVQKTFDINASPEVDFSPTVACQNVEVKLQSQGSISQGSIVRYEWKFTNESNESESIVAQHIAKTFPAAGEVPMRLEVTSDKGCSSSIQKNITVRPAPELIITHSPACENSQTYFFDRTQYSDINIAVSRKWTINKQVVGEEQALAIVLNEPTTIQFWVQTTNGCELSGETTIEPFPLPQVLFDSVYACPNTPLTLKDYSNGMGSEIDSRTWIVNNVRYNEAQPELQFAELGTYEVLLIVKTASECIDSLHSAITIMPEPNADFTYAPLEGILGEPITFTNNSTHSEQFTWIFPYEEEIETNSIAPISHTFTDSLNTRVKLIAHSPLGCNSSLEKTVPIKSAHYSLQISNCNVLENSYGKALQILVINTGNAVVRNIAFTIEHNSIAPYLALWQGELAAGETLAFSPHNLTQSAIEYVSIQAQILDSPQGEALFSTYFSRDFSNAFTVHSLAPIPARENITLRFASISTDELTITLFNMQGNESFSTHYSPSIGFNQITIPLTKLAAGRYECHITQNGQRVKKTIWVQ